MQSKITLLIGIFIFIPIITLAQEIKVSEYESLDIKRLIEKAKEASLEDRTKIENLIRKKIAKAHRETDSNG